MFFLLLCAFSSCCIAQNAGFSMPDTICEDKPVFITDVQPPSAISYKWSFCSGNASDEPDGINMGNPDQLLNAPRYITVVQDGPDYYTFTTSTGNSKIVRNFYGAYLTQFPLTTTDLGSFGQLTDQVRGIQVINDKGIWYGFVANGNKLVRLVFGNSPANTPSSAQVIILPNVTAASGLAITRQGTVWIGFLTDIEGYSLFRLEFNQGPGVDPLVTNLGSIGQMNAPSSIVLAEDNDIWYAFICNIGNNTLSRITFGSSLLNPAPVGMNLSNINGLNLNAGISLINDCGVVNGIVTNCINESDFCILHIGFQNGLGGPVTGYIVPNNGILNKPYGISEFVRQGDTLYAFVANFGSSSLTRVYFPSCSGASLPFYNGPDPPPVTYPDPGNYNILLTVKDNNSTLSSHCKNIVVMPTPELSLGNDLNLCQGMNALLDGGSGDSTYLWSTGDTTQTISVDATGTYWVHVVNQWNCEAADTINIMVNDNSAVTVDTTICKGLSYWAQQAMQVESGIYLDSLKMVSGCDSVVTTNLQVDDCPLLIWFPNAFTPNGDGLNDLYRPIGKYITRYSLRIYDRWGGLIFESGDITFGWDGLIKGTEAGPDVYTYHAIFESSQFPGVTHRNMGTFTLSK